MNDDMHSAPMRKAKRTVGLEEILGRQFRVRLVRGKGVNGGVPANDSDSAINW